MSLKEAWQNETDLNVRDPNSINNHLTIAFEDVIAEPDSTHSLDCVWKYSFKCYTLWKQLCYLILTTLCGILTASCWGCYFACIAFQHVWHNTPCIRAYEINLNYSAKIYRACLAAFCDPCCESIGKIFSAFKKE